jgi:lipopolysaccharide/colanic/teichoic acid biosynthesis glycosyltransferase
VSSFTTRKHWIHQRTIARPGPFSGALHAPDLRLTTRVRGHKRLPQLHSERLRRLLNILVATIGIIATAPIMLVVAILVKLTSPGPVIYTQPRVGLDRRGNRGPGAQNYRRNVDHGGKLFTIYKFRTMRDDPKAGERWASRTDPRITRVGAFLRATRIDELPQLFNVLKGDMNIVGPRPEQPQIFSELRQQVSRYEERQRVLPGITGLAQVNFGYDQTIDDVKRKVELDLQYIDKRSPAEDLMIMAKTMPVMVFRKVWM